MSTLIVDNLIVDPLTVNGSISASGSIQGNNMGRVLQVVQEVHESTSLTTATDDFVSIPFHVSITPSSTSSKILVSFHAPAYCSDANFHWLIYYGIGIADPSAAGGSYSALDSSKGYHGGGGRQGYHNSVNVATQILHSPATTSQVTYKMYLRKGAHWGGNPILYVGRVSSDAPVGDHGLYATAMEIAG